MASGRSARHLWLAVAAIALSLLGGEVASTRAQTLTGEWVREAEQRIDEHRKTDVRIIVLDEAGESAPGAKLRVEQLSHAFNLGFALPESGWLDPATLGPLAGCFNAVSVAALAGEPGATFDGGGAAGERFARLIAALHAARQQGWTVRWGPVISADPAFNPQRLVAMNADVLQEALLARVADAVGEHRGLVHQYDIYADAVPHDFVERRLGVAMLRRLYERARAADPSATLCLHAADAMTGPRLQQAIQRLAELRQVLVPIDALAIEPRFTGMVVSTALQRSVKMLDNVDAGVMIVGFEVGGASESAAALNLETVLRVLFASPAIDGIWLRGLYAEQFNDSAAALLTERGEPTEPGDRLANMFTRVWNSDGEHVADELGNVRTRVFAGRYRLHATLPDGATAEMLAWIPRSDAERIVLLQPAAAPTDVTADADAAKQPDADQ